MNYFCLPNMIRQHFFLVCIFLVVRLYSSISAYEVIDSSDEGVTISCACGKDNLKMHINLSNVTEILENIVKSNLNSTNILFYPDFIRDYFQKCSTCKISISRCWGNSSSEKYACKENFAELVMHKNETIDLEFRSSPEIHIHKKDTVEYPIYDYIPIGGLNRTRPKRDDDPCRYPTSLSTADLLCVHYPSKVMCTARCAFGYTLNEGTTLNYHCKKKENRWMPHKFRECKPYVDCTISLTSGGKARCRSATLTEGPICQVKCYKFEDKKARQRKGLKCDINGKWSPKLPFCAQPGSGIQLVNPPEDT